MKLYNLFEELILEAKLLNESVSDDDVIKALEGKYFVKITYDESESGNNVSNRTIGVYNLGHTKAGNRAIRVFQIGGDSKTTVEGAWKTLRLDRIMSWRPTKMKFYKPASDYSNTIPMYNENPSGQEKETSPMGPPNGHVDRFVKFDRVKYPKTQQSYTSKTGASRELTDKEREELYNTKRPTLVPTNKPKYEKRKPIDTSATTGPKK
jgi:hypothetical protein